ncbi:DUF4190 domain-containing protein [Micrococcus luteus]|uniref:DUF4190 domain-containing protein n=1 Tax=Micrococcus luteus TaxID=1270 RepID=UPI0036CE97F4
MTDPHASHDPRREAARPSWYGSEAGAGSSGTGSSAAGWPDAPTGDADRAAWDQAPSYAEQEEQTRPAYGQPYGYGQDANTVPAYGYGQGTPGYGFGAPLQPGQTEGVGRSVASMILGIISVVGGFTFLIPPIVGVVLGHLGLKREPHGRGMAIAGLVMNYVSLALLLLAVVFLVILVIAGISLGDYTST